MMVLDFRTADPSRRFRGIAIALAVHILLAWLLISGTARKGFELLNKPLQAVVIQDVVVAPPPPPAPKVVVPPKAQTVPAQPPPFIPVAEVPVTAPTTFAVEATAVVHEAPPPVPAPVVVVAAPPAPAPAARLDMAIVCPTQVAPEMPRRALIDGTQGVVRAQVRIADGAVRDVTFLSGPRIFYAAVRAAMLQYKCTRESSEVVATQEFNFKLQP
jgi:protein TonB